jgi:gliding motility-associated transport system permease protein
VTAFRALVRKELATLFASPLAYLALTLVMLVTALIFFDHLRIYNQILFLYASSTMGGFETGTVPDHINLRDSVFFPVLENLGITLIALIPVITMRVFAEERARGTDELLLTTHLSPGQIVGAKFLVTYGFVVLMMAGSFVYPAMATVEGGIGAEHLLAVFVGLSLHALGLASLGLACSAWSGSQLVAAVSSWAVGFVLWDFAWAGAFVSEPVGRLLDAISMHQRYGSFAEGIVNLEHFAYFVGLGLVCAAIARFAFDWRRVAG